jgi:hypothetical protein
MGAAKSVHASKNVELRNPSFIVAPHHNFSSGEEHGSTEELARFFLDKGEKVADCDTARYPRGFLC